MEWSAHMTNGPRRNTARERKRELRKEWPVSTARDSPLPKLIEGDEQPAEP